MLFRSCMAKIGGRSADTSAAPLDIALLHRVPEMVSTAVEEARAQTDACDKEDLLRLRQLCWLLKQMVVAVEGVVSQEEHLEATYKRLPIRALWVLSPAARAERKRLQEMQEGLAAARVAVQEARAGIS